MGPGIAQNGNSNREGDENKVPLDIPFWTIPNAATMWLVTAQFKSVWTSCSRRTSIGLSFLESIEA